MGSNAMLMMLAAHLRPYRRWEFVGISAYQTTATLSYPEATQAGDVAILAFSSTLGGSAPTGFTAIAAGSSLQYYRICTGDETSVARPTVGGGHVLLFRPVGGVAAFHSGATDSPSTSRTMSTPSDKTCLLVAVGNYPYTGSSNWSAALPASSVTHVNRTVGPSLYVATAALPSGTSSTGAMLINMDLGAPRQTFGIFTI